MTTNELKILFISHDASRTGAPILLLNLASVLIEKNIKIDFLLKRGGELEKNFGIYGAYKIAFKKTADSILDKVKRKFLKKKTKFNLQGLQWKKYDVIISNTITNGDILPQIRSKFKGPIISYIHELSIAANLSTTKKNIEELIIATNKFIAPSIAVRDFLIYNYKISVDKIELLPYFIPNEKNDTSREINNKFIVGGAGFIEWRKGCDLFILTAYEIFKTNPGVNIQFIWRGAQPEIELTKLQHDIVRMGLTDKVKFLPPIEDMSPFYHSLSVFLLTSREDPYPLVVIEAASMSIPTICFKNAGGAQEFINSCDGGTCVEYSDTNGMASAVLTYYYNSSQLRDAGKRAKDGLQKTHQDPQYVFDQFNQIINRTI